MKHLLKKTSLLPDVIALEEDGITWFEIDASRRGPDRMAKLMRLIKKVGSSVANVFLSLHPNRRQY